MKKKSFSEDNYIDIAELLSKIWKKKIFILKSAVFSIILGVIYSLSLTNIYKSSSKFYPHYEEVDNSSGLRSLAGLAGINLNNQAATNIPTNLYPNLIKSINFKKKILNQEVIFNDQIITYRKYLLLNVDKISFNLFNNILQKLYQNNNSVKINKDLIIDLEYINQEDYGLFKTLDNNIELSVNQENGFIELSVFDKNPEISAIIAKKANIILQQNIIDFKIKNINELYNFTTNQLNIAKNNLYKLQDSLANFKDSNRSIKSDIFKNVLPQGTIIRVNPEYLKQYNNFTANAIYHLTANHYEDYEMFKDETIDESVKRTKYGYTDTDWRKTEAEFYYGLNHWTKTWFGGVPEYMKKRGGVANYLFSKDTGLVFPILDEIAILKTSSAILATSKC